MAHDGRRADLMRELSICFGALASSMRSQFKALGIKATDKQLTRWQSQADAIVQLYLGELLTDGEVNKCRKRLIKRIAEDLAKNRAPAS